MSSTDYSLEAHYRKADRIMLGVLWLMLVYSLGLAAWNGTWGQALLVGGGTLACMQVLAVMIPASRLLPAASLFFPIAARRVSSS